MRRRNIYDDIVTGYELDSRSSIPGSVPTSLLSNGYSGLLPWRSNSHGVKLTTHVHLVPRSRMVELYFHSPICPDGIVLE
jgi:hypothetical protein